MLLLKIIYENLLQIHTLLAADKRITTYPTMGGPWFMVSGICLYLLVVLKWGPRFMASRKPFKVEGLMKIYNVIQILLNMAIFYESLRYSYWRKDFHITCEKYDLKDTRPQTMKLVRPVLLYYISKYMDMFDTIFFLLRKKQNQITFLHVYHHSAMVIGVYLYTTLAFASHLTATGVVNSFIHIVMYSYYLVAAMKPNLNFQPWKRRLTGMQLIQFAYLTIHFCMPLIHNWCNIGLTFIFVTFVQNLFMIALFSNFYYTTYIVKDRKIKIKMESAILS